MPTIDADDLRKKESRIGEAIVRAGWHAIDGNYDQLASYAFRAASLWYALAPRERKWLAENDPTYLDAPDGTGEYREDAFAAWVAWRCAAACKTAERPADLTQATLAVESSVAR